MLVWPRDSWMWPCRLSRGWYFSMAARTAALPAPYMTGVPPEVTTLGGSVVQSSSAAVSSVLSFGGAWKLKITREKSPTPATMPSMCRASSSSGTSRGVSHGVGLLRPELSMRCSSSSMTTCFSSQSITLGPSCLMSGSRMSGESSLPPVM